MNVHLFIWDRIRELNEQATTIVLTTHDMDEAQQLCNHIAIMHHGRILVLDTIDGLLQQVPGSNTLEDVFIALTGGTLRL